MSKLNFIEKFKEIKSIIMSQDPTQIQQWITSWR